MTAQQSIESGFSRVQSAQPALPHAHLVTVECDIIRGIHAFTIVGLPDKAVEEAKDRIAAAIKNTSHTLESPKRSNKKIVFSLAPAELKKEGAVFDLPLAISFLLASGQIKGVTESVLFAGELALDGTLRPIRGALSIAECAKRHNYDTLIIPKENCDEASLVSDVCVIGASHLREVIDHLTDTNKTLPRHVRERRTPTTFHEEVSLDDIKGQEHAKRALEIAVAGRHNIALYGPPGTGKTMLARAAASLLPDLTEDEMLEVTAIHSYAGHTTGVVARPPLRTPHHTSSYASLIGGGAVPKPGEVTLAHRGILFLDEFPEFHRDVINALREPLEDMKVSVSRARGSSTFPAYFLLIAALNPCPCGKAGSTECVCMPHLIEKYRRKISGPIADRIDMWVHVGAMPLEVLTLHSRQSGRESAEARTRVARARAKQRDRFLRVQHAATNADMRPKDIEAFANLSKEAETTLLQAARTMKLSARGFHRTIKLARTIADLVDSSLIEHTHMLEALQYRQREF